MDFLVNKEAQTVEITREFDAERDLVWDAYTKQELLDQWWAPKPLTSDTVAMDFEVGGRRFYAMVMPDGTRRWAVQRYTSITPKDEFKFFNAFADENENVQLPGSDWTFTFTENGDKTTVHVSIYNESRERMEMILADGNFQKGSESQLENLRELLARLSAKTTAA
jgi:uncharacterized protein YndB with AHSA1/START domain